MVRNGKTTPKPRRPVVLTQTTASLTAREDAAILAAIAHGDLRQFDVFVDRYKNRLMSYIGHRVADRHLAEDLVQESFLRMFRAARNNGYSGQASVCTWLFTIADNCVTDYLRVLGRRPVALECDVSVPGGEMRTLDCRPSRERSPVASAEYRESQTRADALLDRLPAEQRRIVALKILGELTVREIADMLGCPLGTVKSRLLYGLRKIEAMLTEESRCENER